MSACVPRTSSSRTAAGRDAYFRRSWSESRDDEFDSWGTSDWFFETDGDGRVIRQVERYLNGVTLGYGPDLEQDAWGFLTFEPLDLVEFGQHRVKPEDFEAAWAQVTRPQGPSTG